MKAYFGILMAFILAVTAGCGGEEFTQIDATGGEAGSVLDAGTGGTGGDQDASGGSAGSTGGTAGEGGTAGIGTGGIAGAAGEGGTAGVAGVGSTGGVAGQGGSTGGVGGQGGSAGTTGGTGGQPMLCSPGSTQCSGDSVETCAQDGQSWQTTQACPFVCSAGACTGVCEPGTKKCDGLTTQTCNAQGQWENGITCSFVCSQGSCSGACTPDDTQCNGNDVQTCNSSGQWATSQSCPFVCAGGACGGVCSPGATKCTGTTVETCNAQGQWTTGASCPFLCSAGACTGVCTPGTKVCDGTGTKTCNAQGQWSTVTACPGNVHANPTCSAGVCGTTCQTGYADCTSAPGCESDLSSPSTCGSCGNSCNSNGGTATCSAGSCGISCDSNHANCNGSASDGCEVTLGSTTNCSACGDTCTAPAHAVGMCSNKSCDFACTGLWDDCDGVPGNGCEMDVSNDPQNCGGCGISCYGGSCVAGTCEYPVEEVAESVAPVNFMTVDTGSVYWTTGGGDNSVYKAAKATGSVSTLVSANSNGASGIATDGIDVFFSGTSTLNSVPVGGGSKVSLASYGPSQFATDGIHIYWTDQSYAAPCYCTTAKTTKIFRMPVEGGSVQTFATIPYASYPEVKVDDSRVYLASHGPYDSGTNEYSGRIYAISKVAGVPGVIASCGPLPTQTGCTGAFRNGMAKIAINSTHVFFQADVNDYGRDLYRVPLGGGTVEWISYEGNWTSMAADDSYVYMAGGSSVVRVPVNSGPMEMIATGQISANSVTLDSTHVYWKTAGFSPLGHPQWTEYGIMRAPK